MGVLAQPRPAKSRWLLAMDPHITTLDIVVRLALTLAAGAVLGVNRSQRGRAAGLRTTILIGLAAATAMIVANLLLATDARGPADYVRMDVMRLPLGILSGIGFIGAGAIVKRNDLVQGVTTAAMLWLMTMIGLVFGAGYLWLGVAVTALAFAVVWGLKFAESLIAQEHRAALVVAGDSDALSEPELRDMVARAGLEVLVWQVAYLDEGRRWEVTCDLGWRSTRREDGVPDFVPGLARRAGMTRVEWNPHTAEATPR